MPFISSFRFFQMAPTAVAEVKTRSGRVSKQTPKAVAPPTIAKTKKTKKTKSASPKKAKSPKKKTAKATKKASPKKAKKAAPKK